MSASPSNPAGATTPIFTLSNVGKSYPLARSPLERLFRRGSFHAVSGVNLDVAKGDALAIVGESGSGKSTVARMMVGLTQPTTGAICFKGDALGGMTRAQNATFRQGVQMVFQSTSNSLNPRKTIATSLAEAIGFDGVPVRQLLEMVRLPEFVLTRYPHQLSGGQRQRVGIARALARRPELVVADEPTSALDVSIQAEIIRLLQDLHRSAGVSLVVISHDLALVGELCRRVVVMREGRVVEAGAVEQVLFEPRERYTAELLAAIPKGIERLRAFG
ncbi:ABC transporter ATP-binding protein [Paraburkholderia sp. BCC1886]|uniref:ABC transporter ATP-binding protein n=1 Tax=Paraburkholderia sp. BCC1886 TaxID=2562670 RepID=UPI001182A9A4|nr:ATP-binding cassette domain-containing protein [Paraburkholderia sp. BCC1886]